MKRALLLATFLLLFSSVWPKKSVLDYNEADVERIYREWEENDPDEDEDDDEWLKPPGPPQGGLNIEDLKNGKIDPQDMIRQSKKGKPIMIFIGVRGQPDRTRTEEVSRFWAQSLQNAQLQVQRYVVADDRVLLMVEDGSLAWDVKDYLITQTTCTNVSFEQQTFNCAGWSESNEKTEL